MRRVLTFRCLRLPSIDFQPEFLAPNEGSSSRAKCEPYSGSICRSIIGSHHISTVNPSQKDIEQSLVDNLKLLTKNQFLSHECHRFLLPMICLFTFPLCDQDRTTVRSLCRHSCQYFQSSACPNLFSYQQKHQQQQGLSNRKTTLTCSSSHPYAFLLVQILQNIPTCESLPPTSDDPSCMNLDHTEFLRRNGMCPFLSHSMSTNARSLVVL